MQCYKDMFPIFTKYPELNYMDSASTCQKPKFMIDSLSEFYSDYNSNIGRGAYPLADSALRIYEDSKTTIAKFFNTISENIAFTYSATDSLNQIAYFIEQQLENLPSSKKNGYLILSFAEHHSNILPWMRLAKKHNLKTYLSSIEELLDPSIIPNEVKEKSIAYICSHVSNITGEILPIEKWIAESKLYNSYSVIDGSQAVGSFRVDLQKLFCNFYAFSAHKMYGPIGIGVLFMSTEILNKKNEPFRLGGGIVDDILTQNNEHFELISYNLVDSINKFEAGSPNVANAYAFAKTIDWMLSIQWYNCTMFMSALGKYMYKSLTKNDIKFVEFSPELKKTHIASFIVPNVHSHDMATFLAKKGISVRAGKHCAYPLYDVLGVNSSTRASIGLYNTNKNIDDLVNNIHLAKQFFS